MSPLPGLTTKPKRLAARPAAPARPVDPEIADLTRRFRLAVRLTVVVVLAAIGGRIPGVAILYYAPPRFWSWFQLVLSTPIVLWTAAPLWKAVLGASLRGRADRSTPVVIGVAALWIYSVVATVRPDLFPLPYLDESGAPRLFFEAATVVVTLVLVMRVIEARARVRPAVAAESLLGLVPPTARRLRPDGLEEDARVSALEPGETVRVWLGEPVPLDGVVVEGRSTLDESKVTGDVQPRVVGAGDVVLGGVVNREGGPLVVRIEKGSGDHFLARVVRTLKEALDSRAAMDRLAERCAAALVAVTLLVAIATFALWWSRGPEPKLLVSLLNAAAVLLVVAPGAFVLAARAAIAGAIVRGASAGIVFRDASAIERLRDADTLVVSMLEPIDEDDVGALRGLRSTGLRVVLWMADGAAVSGAPVPAQLGVEVADAPTSPETVIAALAPYRARKSVVAIAAPAAHGEALAQAAVGIALGSVLEGGAASTGVSLVRGDLRSVLRARRLARAAVRNQKQGLWFVFACTALAVPVAAGALRPYLGFLLDPMVAAAAAGWCTLMVLANALRLRGQEL